MHLTSAYGKKGCPSCGCVGACSFARSSDECHNSYHDAYKAQE